MKSIPLSFLAALFGFITRIRNFCYDKGWFKSFSFPRKNVVVVGNLAVGGTGKSPFVTYLVKNWPENLSPVILSRGYGRKTKGFLWAAKHETANRIGDEPLTYRLNFPDLPIALGENRVHSINQILNDLKETQSILLDDAFQHRALRASLNLVCTTYQNPFYQDDLLPKGRLRESIDGIKRAHAVIVNRCPNTITAIEMDEMTTKIQQVATFEIPVFFTGIHYQNPVGEAATSTKWTAIAGIAHPELFFQQIADSYDLEACRTFPDHYDFKASDLEVFETQAVQMTDEQGFITTFKDYVRLLPALETYSHLRAKLCYLPMEIHFIRHETEFLNWFQLELQKSTS